MYLDEHILYAANFTRTGTGLDQWRFLVFTNKRYFKTYHLTQVSEGVWYKKSGISLFRKSSELNRQWIFPPKILPPMAVKEQRVDEFSLSDIKGIVKNNYTASHHGLDIELVELRFDFYNRYKVGYKVFEAKDGEYIAKLIQS